MMQEAQPHLQYLERLYIETVSRAGLPQPNLVKDELQALTPQYTPEQRADFGEYFDHAKGVHQYFVECYDLYAEKFDRRLDRRPKFVKNQQIWLLATVAFAGQHLANDESEVPGALRSDIVELGLGHPNGSHELTPCLTRLVEQRIVVARQDARTWQGPDGLWRPLLRYKLSENPPTGGGKRRRARVPKQVSNLGLRPAVEQ